MDWEQWLRTAGKRPSDHEDSKRQRTEDQIRKALADYEPLQGRPYRVFVKGSYANNTNVRLNYDVDIAVEYGGYFYSDLAFELEGQPKSVVGVSSSDDPYTRDEFREDIKGALVKAFGSSAVSVGRIALRVREKKTTLPADVVPSWEYRRYDRIINGVPTFHVGSCVYPRGGSQTVNYPGIQRSENNKKNTRTSKRYKRMVRALKKIQTRLVRQGQLDEELASYLTECLVYNVIDNAFGHDTYRADMREVLAQIFNATISDERCKDWEEVHGLTYLFRAGKWSRSDVHAMANAAWDELGFE